MSKNKILVIDDDKLVLKSVKQLLGRAAYEVFGANNCHEALELIQQNQFNLIISDIRMPETDGIAVIKKIKDYFSSKKLPEIPIIFITGYASDDAPIDAIKLGAKDYLLKPFDLDELLNSVRQHIQ